MTKLTRVERSLQCTHAGDAACVNQGAGHAMSAIQQRVVAATPSRWRDGLLRSVAAGGWIAVELIEGGETVWLWHHADLTARGILGQPVAVHDKYGALAIGAERLSVLTVAPIIA